VTKFPCPQCDKPIHLSVDVCPFCGSYMPQDRMTRWAEKLEELEHDSA